MRQEIIYNLSHNGIIKGYKWEIDNPRGIVVIAHGMAEHILRYDELAEFLASNGYIVIGHDHYAHGNSAKSVDAIGEVTDYDFMDAVIKGMKHVRDEFSQYIEPGKSYLFAHSMGAMASIRYIELYNDFDKVILSGPDGFSIKYNFAKLLTGLFNKKNKIVYSNFVLSLSTGSFNKKFKKDHPKYGWLSSNLENVLKYADDPMCGKDFPVNYFHSLSTMMVEAKKSKNISKINKNTKIFLYSGSLDPVNNYHKAIKGLYNTYTKYGLNVSIKEYKDARHEVHNEINSIKFELYQDILKFLKEEVI